MLRSRSSVQRREDEAEKEWKGQEQTENMLKKKGGPNRKVEGQQMRRTHDRKTRKGEEDERGTRREDMRKGR